MRARLLVLLVALCITGCSEYDEARERRENAFQTQMDALEKAKNVENVLMEGAQRRAEEAEKY